MSLKTTTPNEQADGGGICGIVDLIYDTLKVLWEPDLHRQIQRLAREVNDPRDLHSGSGEHHARRQHAIAMHLCQLIFHQKEYLLVTSLDNFDELFFGNFLKIDFGESGEVDNFTVTRLLRIAGTVFNFY